MSKHVVVVGSSNTDMILQMARIPRPGETILGGAFSMAAGGKGANQAVGAARAGGIVTFVARVGRDMFGKEAVRGFERERVPRPGGLCWAVPPRRLSLLAGLVLALGTRAHTRRPSAGPGTSSDRPSNVQRDTPRPGAVSSP